MSILYILLGIAMALILWIIFAYNRLIALTNRSEEAWSDIDVQLTPKGAGNVRTATSFMTPNAYYFNGVTSSEVAFVRNTTAIEARLGDLSGFCRLKGKIQASTNAVAETPSATHTLRMFDGAGTEYKVLAVAA